MAETADTVLASDRGGGVRLLTINRPQWKNALNLDVKRRIAAAAQELATDPTVRAIVITGAGDCFAAGTDIAEMEAMTPVRHTLDATDRMFVALRQCPKPMVAAVEGYALGGGCELALTCDLVVAAEGARLGLPEIKVGVMPGAGGLQRLVRTIGKYRTLRLVLTGDAVGAPEAHALGLVSEVTPDGGALVRALELAATIAAMPPLAVASIKEAVQFAGDASFEASLALERRLFQILFDSADQKEGMRAFLEKRPPKFTGS
jgi:enoyl-CoA hydratase/carnithine racemase